jgi:branched-chain amino acid transport system substrate-binding protein
MAREWIGDLISQLHHQKIDRREFVQRATALGLSAGLIGQALRAAPVGAQDATPEAGSIGMAGIEHLTDTSKGTVKFYSSWPMIAASEQIGGDSREAVIMALDDFGNAAGGFALQYEALDDAIAATGSWDAGKESENANKTINDADAMVYIGTYNSGAAAISIPILNEIPMAMISPANTYPGLTQAVPGVTAEGEPDKYYPTGKRNYMRNTVADHLQGGAQAQWAIDQGYDTAYVLHDNQLYGKGVALAFQLYFEQLGGEILGFEGYDPEVGDYQTLATSIADKGPKIIHIGAIVNLNPSKVVKDLRSVMSPDDVVIITPDGCYNQAFIDGAGEEGEGTYATFGGVPPDQLESEIGVDWYTRIKERLGHEPDAYATYAYEAAVISLQAVDKVQEKDRAKILDAMWATEEFQGLSGIYSFTESGDPDKPAIFLGKIEGGAFTKVDYISPPTT